MVDRHVPLVLAHRGVSAEFKENTLEAFAAAASRGADGVELDVRRTADDRLVVHHDAHLDDGRAIVDLPRVTLPPHVPSLAEALDACATGLINIEVKNFPGDPDFDEDCRVARATVALVRDKGIGERVIVSGFNYDDIMTVRATDPALATGWLVIAVDDVDTMLGHVVRDGHRALHPPDDRTTGAVVQAAHAQGVQVNTWTVDDPERIVALAAMGVDAVITNDPATARGALDRWLGAA